MSIDITKLRPSTEQLNTIKNLSVDIDKLENEIKNMYDAGIDVTKMKQNIEILKLKRVKFINTYEPLLNKK